MIWDPGFKTSCRVELVRIMGDDLAIARAAWVSTNRDGSAKDVERLLRYLARHEHWTPFGHAQATLLIEAPIFVLRQLMRSNVGVVWNEESRRYVDRAPEFFIPEHWRKRGESIKQGSLDDPVDDESEIMELYIEALRVARQAYWRMLDRGVAPEQARMVLPVSTFSRVMGTGSVAFWARVVKLRKDHHAQREIQELANKIGQLLRKAFPIAWKALMEA